MKLQVVLALVLCCSLTSNGKGLLTETELSQLTNDTAEFILNQLEEDSDLEMDSLTAHVKPVPNQLEEDAMSFLEKSSNLVPEQFFEDRQLIEADSSGDIDECAVKNGGCSHDCTNTIGSYMCSCPDPELSLAYDKHSCEAKGVIINCLQNEMSITIPKPLLKGMDREHVRLLEPTCGATETPTHFNLKTPLTGCKTTRRHTTSAIVYSNKVQEIPLEQSDVIKRVREIDIPFSCYYSNSGMATAVGVKPESRKLVFSEEGTGNFTVTLELFHSKSFETSYSPDDFPLSLKLRQHMYLQVKVDSNDKRLSVMVERSFATPTQNKNDPKKHLILDDGCAFDDTVEFLPSPTGYYRFDLEAFEFVDQPAFVFIHCHVIICNASDAQSRCARGCENNDRRRREVEHDTVYTLAQGPITLDYNNEYQEQDKNLAVKKMDTAADGVVNVPLLAAMVAITTLAIFGVAFMGLRKRSRDAGYLLLKE